jgi:hypothetical protein
MESIPENPTDLPDAREKTWKEKMRNKFKINWKLAPLKLLLLLMFGGE